MTFPGGTHDLWIRYWLAAGGIDPDKDIETIVVPPPQMVANMKVGTMDAFCVGEPWNEQLVHQKIGYTALTTGELWKNHPEKALGMRADWVDKYPKAAKALLMAVMEAQQWCDEDGEQGRDGRDHRQAPVVQRAGRRHHRPHQGQLRLRHRQCREAARSDEVLGATTPPIRSRATTSGSSPRTSAGASSTPDYRHQGADRARSTARTSGATRPRTLGVAGCAISRPRHRAARRPSSTARSSIRRTRRPTSKPRHQARRSLSVDADCRAGAPSIQDTETRCDERCRCPSTPMPRRSALPPATRHGAAIAPKRPPRRGAAACQLGEIAASRRAAAARDRAAAGDLGAALPARRRDAAAALAGVSTTPGS